MRLQKFISFLTIILSGCIITGLLSSCIHTYPDPESSVDPTEISLNLELKFNDEWGQLSVDSRSSVPERRLLIEIRGSGTPTEKINRVISEDEIINGIYKLELTSKFKAQKYKLAIWMDYIHPDTSEPLGYDISDTDLITELHKRGEETDERICLTAIEEIDLSPLEGKWEAEETIALTLSSPMTRFRLVAADYAEFLLQTEEARRRGEKYYVTVRYDDEIPGGFSLSDGLAMMPVEGGEFSTPLPILTIPGIEMCVASDWLFAPPSPYIHTVTLTVFNSAKAMVSQTPAISVPTERGKITTVAGKLLTNFISGGIQIDNIWAGEIIIEID